MRDEALPLAMYHVPWAMGHVLEVSNRQKLENIEMFGIIPWWYKAAIEPWPGLAWSL